MLKVLKNSDEIAVARRELRKRGVDCLSNKFTSFLRRFGILRTVAVGDPLKSWDLLQMIDFFERNIPRSGKVVDIGAFASEMLPALERLGYTNLLGIDLNPQILRMPARPTTTYRVGNFYQDISREERFDAITAISVIEHGFDADALIKMLTSNLKEGGVFLATCDYWPQKVDTSSLSPFDLSWTIFSRQDLEDFFALAALSGLHPVGEIDYTAQDKVINWSDRRYTFAWFALRKTKIHME